MPKLLTPMLLRVLKYPDHLGLISRRQDRSLGKACFLDIFHLSPSRWNVWPG
jgi:hypothetical protein